MAVNNASNPQNSGSFIPTTQIWDVTEVYAVEKIDPKLQELLVRMYQNLNLMALALNTKESGFYVLSQFVDGNVWFPNPTLNSNSSTTPALRQEYCKVINFGALPNNASTPIAHGITVTTATSFTAIYGVATKPTSTGIGFSYLPIPYASATAADVIEINVDATNVNITTGASANARNQYTITYVVLKWLQN